jgi:hypothetical protein
MSRDRTIIAGAVVAAALGFGALLGLGGVAGAQTTPTGGSGGGTAVATAKCSKAQQHEATIQNRLTKLQQHLAKLDAKITQATDAHRDQAVAKLTAQRTTVQARADALTARLAAIQSRCPANG